MLIKQEIQFTSDRNEQFSVKNIGVYRTDSLHSIIAVYIYFTHVNNLTAHCYVMIAAANSIILKCVSDRTHYITGSF